VSEQGDLAAARKTGEDVAATLAARLVVVERERDKFEAAAREAEERADRYEGYRREQFARAEAAEAKLARVAELPAKWRSTPTHRIQCVADVIAALSAKPATEACLCERAIRQVAGEPIIHDMRCSRYEP
jgi:hypothetical protein